MSEETNKIQRAIELENADTQQADAGLILNNIQEADVQVIFENSAGQPVEIDGLAVWDVDRPDICMVEVGEGGRSAVVRTLGPTGTAYVGVSADARIGDGVVPIMGTLEVTVTQSEAVRVRLIPGPPRSRVVTANKANPAPDVPAPTPATQV